MTEAELRTAASALKAAKACLSGEISAVEASWILSSFVFGRNRFVSAEDRNLFVVVQSETDALPVGALAENWHFDFLPAKLEELNRYESVVSCEVRDACGRVIAALEAAGVE